MDLTNRNARAGSAGIFATSGDEVRKNTAEIKLSEDEIKPAPLDQVEAFLKRFVSYPSDHARVAHVLWIAHTHMMEVWDTTPRLAFMSAEKESGKTRALEVTELFVLNPVFSVSASTAVIVRIVSSEPTTILYDEIDAVFGNAKVQENNSDLRSVLNGGYRRGAKVHRCVVRGNAVGIEQFDAFAPVAVAGLRELPDTLASRAIIIRMKRRASDEYVEPFRNRLHILEASPIKDALVAWCDVQAPDLNLEPDLPDGVEDRTADCWEPLLSIADAAGGDWPERARKAATYLANVRADDLTKGVELLAHIREAFGDADRLNTTELLQRLCNRDESPWMEINYGKPLNERGLAVRLKGYGIKSKVIRIGDRTPRGYASEDFADAWSRYCPLPSDIRNKRNNFDNNNNNVADVAEGMTEAAEPDERASVIEFNQSRRK